MKAQGREGIAEDVKLSTEEGNWTDEKGKVGLFKMTG